MGSNTGNSNLTCEFCGNETARVYDWNRPRRYGGLIRFCICENCQKDVDRKIDQIEQEVKKLMITEFKHWVASRQRYWESTHSQIKLPGV